MKTNKNGVKLLAAIMVFAMAFAGCVILADDNVVDATVTKYVSADGDDVNNNGNAEATPYKTISKALNEKATAIVLVSDYVIKDLTIPKDIELQTKGHVLTVDGTITLNGILNIDDRKNIKQGADFEKIVLSSSSAVILNSVKLLGTGAVALVDSESTKAAASVTSIEEGHGFTVIVSDGNVTVEAGYLFVGTDTRITIGEGVTATITANSGVTNNGTLIIDGTVVANKDLTNNGTVVVNGELSVSNGVTLQSVKGGFSSESAGKVTVNAGATVHIGDDKVFASDGIINLGSGKAEMKLNTTGTTEKPVYGFEVTILGTASSTTKLPIAVENKLVVGDKSTLTVSGTFVLAGQFVAGAGSSVTISGAIDAQSTGNAVVEAGAVFTMGSGSDVVFGKADTSGAWIVMDGGYAVLEKNTVGTETGICATLVGTKATIKNNPTIRLENRLVVDEESTLIVDGKLTVNGELIIENEKENTNALGFITGSNLTIGEKGKIANGDDSWTLTKSDSKVILTFDNYDGKQYFNGKFDKVLVKGTNNINVDVTGIKDSASTPAIHSTSVFEIDGEKSGELIINYKSKEEKTTAAIAASSYLTGAGDDYVKDTLDLSIKGVTLTVYADATQTTASSLQTAGIMAAVITITDSDVQVYAGNRGIYATSTITITESDVVAAGFEKGLRSNASSGASITINGTTNGSCVQALLLDGEGVNSAGTDERFGVKVNGTITVAKGSVFETQGFYAKGTAQANPAGTVIVSGDYVQTVKADTKIFTAGLVVTSTKAVDAVEIENVEDAKEGVFSIREGTETYGNINVTPLGSDEPLSQITVSEGTVSDSTIAGNDQIIIGGTAIVGTITLDDEQKMTITPTAKIDVNTKIDIQGKAVVEIQATNTAITTVITVGDSDVNFKNFKGTVQISVGSIVIDGREMSGDLEILEDGTTVKLSGSIAIGETVTVKLTGATTAGTVLVLENSTLNIPETSKLVLENGIKMNNDGQIIGKGTIVVNEGAQFYTSNPVSVNFEGAGKIILEDATETLKLSDKLASSMTTEPTQKVIITGNLTIKQNQYLVITGDLEVPTGVTVTIENGGLLMLDTPTATATIAGTIKSLGEGKYKGDTYAGFTISEYVVKDVIITGDIIAGKTDENQKTVNIEGYAYLEGTITINAKTIANFGDLEVSETGTVNVKGTLMGEMRNQGTVVIDGSVDGAKIFNQAVTAVVQIDNLASGLLTVSDAGLYLQTIESARYYVGGYYITETATLKNAGWAYENKITFQNVEGITVTESIKYITDENGDRRAVNHMEIQGSVSVSNVKEGTISAPVMTIVAGTVDVIETLNLAKAEIVVGTNGILVVYGNINVDDTDMPVGVPAGSKIGITSNGKVIVYGMIRSVDHLIGGTGYVEAVKYEQKVDTKDVYYYTNLADAIASGVKDLEVLGNLTILKDTTIPAGIEIDGTGKNVFVGKDDVTDVTLTVANGGYLSFGTVTVAGTFVIENTDNGVNKMTSITSDTSVITENTAMYTNLLNALDNAESGEVRITKVGESPVILSADATVKKDVTLVVPSSKVLSIVNGVTLTVDGILKLDGELKNVSKSNTAVEGNGFYTQTALPGSPETLYSVIKVTGTVISQDRMVYGEYKIPGAQYELKGKYYLTTIEQAAPVIKTVDGAKIDIYGDNKVESITFEGTAMVPATVNIHGNITADSMTITFGTITVDVGKLIDGTFGSSVGTITMVNMEVLNSLVITDTVVTIDDVDVQKFILSGYVITNQEKLNTAASLTFNGKVEISKNNFGISTNYTSTSGETFGSVVVAEDATVTVSGEDLILYSMDLDVKSKITVNGELITKASGNIHSDVLIVMGTLDVKEAQGSVRQGLISVDNLYVGGTTSSVSALGANAVVNAPASGIGLLYLFPGSTVTGTLKVAMDDDATKSTDFMVEDSLWLTVYDISSSNTVLIKDVKPLGYTDKKFENWQYMSSGKLKGISDTDVLGNYDTVYAKIEYKVYTVGVYACEGIDDVFMDGDIMEYKEVTTTEGGVTITIGMYVTKVVAGNHTISYTLTNGYSGTAVMFVNGDKVSGLSFTAEGKYSENTYEIKLQGIEKSGYVPDTPEPAPVEPTEKDDSLGITEYLLIVLVVLAAILVVVVAIRMMRS